jgi:hypothetical protein
MRFKLPRTKKCSTCFPLAHGQPPQRFIALTPSMNVRASPQLLCINTEATAYAFHYPIPSPPSHQTKWLTSHHTSCHLPLPIRLSTHTYHLSRHTFVHSLNKRSMFVSCTPILVASRTIASKRSRPRLFSQPTVLVSSNLTFRYSLQHPESS